MRGIAIVVLICSVGCATSRARRSAGYAIGTVATVTGVVMLAEAIAHPSPCPDETVGDDVGCAGAMVAGALPGGLVLSLGLTAFIGSVVSSILSPPDPR